MIKQIELFGITDVGRKRTHNEDDFAICKDVSSKTWGFRRGEKISLSEGGAVLVVADGMGGTNAGEVASNLAQKSVVDAFNALDKIPESDKERTRLLSKIIVDAHNTIVEHQHANLETAGMGTTLVIAWIIGDSIHVSWSGDSRCYVYRGLQVLHPFTDDHSMVWEMVKAGKMSPEEARTHPDSNLIMQSLGSEGSPPKPSVRSGKLYKGDRILVCSDGLNGMISDEMIQEILNERKSAAETCADLVEVANLNGGEDNITCLMLDVLDGPPPPPRTATFSTITTAISGSSIESVDSDYDAEDPESGKPGSSNKGLIVVLVVLILAILGGWLWLRPDAVPEIPHDSTLPVTPTENLDGQTDEPSGPAEPADTVRDPVTPQETQTREPQRRRTTDQDTGTGAAAPGTGQTATPPATTDTTTPTAPATSETVTPPADTVASTDTTRSVSGTRPVQLPSEIVNQDTVAVDKVPVPADSIQRPPARTDTISSQIPPFRRQRPDTTDNANSHNKPKD